MGAFGKAMEGLEKFGLVDVLKERIAKGHPTLCVCVGMQVLAATSEESPQAKGLDLIGGRCPLLL